MPVKPLESTLEDVVSGGVAVSNAERWVDRTDANLSTALSGVRISVVIPALNEAQNLPYVFERIPPGVHEVIVIDGHSIDDTIAVARRLRPDVRIVRQDGRGKGNAEERRVGKSVDQV